MNQLLLEMSIPCSQISDPGQIRLSKSSMTYFGVHTRGLTSRTLKITGSNRFRACTGNHSGRYKGNSTSKESFVLLLI